MSEIGGLGYFMLCALACGAIMMGLIARDEVIKRSPALRFRREQKRKTKLAAKLEKISRQLNKLVGRICRLDGARHLFMLGLSMSEILARVQYQKPENFSDEYSLNDSLFKKSPLVLWLDEWAYCYEGILQMWLSWRKRIGAKLDVRKGQPGWNPEKAIELALKLQHLEWDALRDQLVIKARPLQARIDELSKELGIESKQYLTGEDAVPEQADVPEIPKTRVELAREELKQHRVRVAELEEEILGEEQKNSPGPHRRAAGVNTDKT